MGKKLVIGFWIRLLSDIIDYVILGILGYLLSIPLKGMFCWIGESAFLIGVVISFLYFGIFQSSTGGGQTPGNMLLRIQVLRLDGKYLSKSRAFLRFAIPAFLLFNQSIFIGIISLFPDLDTAFFQSIYSLIVAALFVGVSLLVVLHPLKRGIHDLLAGSIVVQENAYHADTISILYNATREIRAFILTGLFIVFLAAGNFSGMNQAEPMRPAFDLLLRQKKVLEQNTRLKRIMPQLVVREVPQPDGAIKEIRGLVLEATLLKPIFEDQNFRKQQVQEAVNLLVGNYPHISKCDYINAKIMTGYNIGIWYFYERVNYFFGPDGKEVDVNKSFQ